MDITKRFNQLLILLTLIFFTSCIRLGMALADDCYYSGTTQNNLKDLQDLSYFAKKVEIDSPWVEFQYNGFSVSKEKYEELIKQKRNKNVDPNLERLP